MSSVDDDRSLSHKSEERERDRWTDGEAILQMGGAPSAEFRAPDDNQTEEWNGYNEECKVHWVRAGRGIEAFFTLENFSSEI